MDKKKENKKSEKKDSPESLFMTLIFQQQKMISELIQQLKLDSSAIVDAM